MRSTSLFILTLALLTSPLSATELSWMSDVDKAMAEAASRDRHVLVDLYADWCGWCKVLEDKVFTTPEFAEFAKDYVLLRVDVEDRGQGSELQAKYGASSLPTTLILSASGVRVGAVSGFAPTPQFIGHMKEAMHLYDESLEVFARLKESKDPSLLNKLANELLERRDGARAAQIYERIRQTSSQPPIPKAWLHYRLADAYRMDGEYSRAEESIAVARSIATDLKQTKMSEQLDLLSFHVAQDRGDCREAMHRLEQFIEHHPRSQMRSQANKTLQKLRKSDGQNC